MNNPVANKVYETHFVIQKQYTDKDGHLHWTDIIDNRGDDFSVNYRSNEEPCSNSSYEESAKVMLSRLQPAYNLPLRIIRKDVETIYSCSIVD